MKRKCGILLVLLLVLSSISTISAVHAKKATVRLKKNNITVGIGSGYGKNIRMLQGKDKLPPNAFTFKSLNPKVAKVTKYGKVIGKKPGNTKIICTQISSGKKLACKVTVQRYVEEIITKNWYLNFHEIGEQQKIATSVYPKNATKKKFSYKSSNEQVVTVDKNGIATCTGEGEAVITITAKDANKISAIINVCLVSGYLEPYGIHEKQKMPHGKVTTISYTSNGGTKQKAVVYTPPEYTSEKKYNVMYLLHGAGDSRESWTKSGGAQYVMDYLYKKQMVKDMILVMLDNAASDTEVEKDLIQYLMPAIEKKYSVETGTEHTALAGYSMGGYLTESIGLQRSDKFGYLGIFSPATGEIINAYLCSKVEDKEANIHKYPLKGIWLSVGSSDDLVYSATMSAKAYLENDKAQAYYAMYGTKYHFYEKVTTTPHSWAEWRNGLYNFAQIAFQ